MAKVIIYVTSWCPHCKKLRNFLDENEIEYVDYDVESDDMAWREAMKKAGGRDIVPVIDIDGKVFYGAFNDALAEKLKKALRL